MNHQLFWTQLSGLVRWRNLGKGKADVVDCQRIIVWNNKRYHKPVVMSHEVFPSVVTVCEAGCIKGELVFADVTYRFVTCLSYIIVQPIIPHRVTSMSEVIVQA